MTVIELIFIANRQNTNQGGDTMGWNLTNQDTMGWNLTNQGTVGWNPINKGNLINENKVTNPFKPEICRTTL